MAAGVPGRAGMWWSLIGWSLFWLVSGENSLYGARDPGINILDRRTVSGALYNSTSAWLVEYYSSWCGHCISYAPTWQSLAADVQDWSPIIKIGVLNCADEENTAICKDYGVQFYPTFRFFSAFTKEFTQGENYKDSDRSVQTVRRGIIDYVQSAPKEHRPSAYPPLEPIGSSDINVLLGRKGPHYTAIVFEDENSYIGREVIMDLIQYENIMVHRALNSDKAVLETLGIVSVPSCYLIYPNGTHGLINIVKPLRSVFSSHLKSLPSVMKKAGARSDLPNRLVQEDDKEVVWKDYDKSKMFAADLESGLHYLFRVELATHQTLEGEKLKTFKDFVTILHKLFPGRLHVMKLLETLQEWLVSMPLDKIPYDAILDIVNNKMRISGIFLTNHIQWVGCQGSKSQLRGYPCSLWKLFHSLTVQNAMKPEALDNTGDVQAVLKVMRRYIREFFGCRECAEHYETMVKESVEIVKTSDEAVLWLWRKHNIVNNRLAGAPSDDPKSPKVQWPTPDLCPACHEEVAGVHSWNEKEVLAFLKRHYSSNDISMLYADPNTDRHDLEDRKSNNLPTKSPRNENNSEKDKPRNHPRPEFLDKLIQNQPNKSKNSIYQFEGSKTSVTFLGIGFSNIDMSLCVVLYITSSLFLMLMYFFFRVRSKRWKIRYNKPYV